MSSAEFSAWATFYQLAPEIARPEYGVAQLCCLLANLLAHRKDGQSWRVEQWLPEEHLRRAFATEEDEARRVLRQFEALEARMR